MKSLIGIVAVAVCGLVWQAECQGQDSSGPYVTPAYNGDYGGTYVSPAFSGGSFGTAPGAAEAPGPGRGGERGARERSGYESPNLGAYSTPAFTGPELGILVSPPAVQRTQPKSSTGKSNPSGDTAPVKPSGISEQQPRGGGTATNRLENPTLPPSLSTNAPAGQGGMGPL